MIQESKNQYSLGFFNIARGMAILVVIAGHSMALFLNKLPVTNVPIVFAGAGRVLGGGLMAMFFMISGFYFFRRTPKKCFKMQSKLLLMPYFLTAATILLATIFQQIIKENSIWPEFSKILVTYLLGFNALHTQTFLGLRVGTVSVFWFLLGLFIGWNIYNLICWIKNRLLRSLCVLFCIVLSWSLSQFSSVWPLAIPASLMAVGYLAAGHKIRKYNLLEQTLPPIFWCTVTFISIVCLAFGYVDVAPGIWKLGLLDVAGSFCIGFLFLRFYAKRMASASQRRPLFLIEYCGLNAIRTLCLHALEKHIIPWQNLNLLFPDSPFLCALLCFLGRLFLIAVHIYLINRIKQLIMQRNRHKIIITDE